MKKSNKQEEKEMFCPNCGKEAQNGAQFCPNCGVKFEEPKAQEPKPVPPVQPVVVQTAPITAESLPAKYRPLSAWAYFGYSILFAIPVIGFIFLIIFSCNGSNINRRSFARSHWCALILCLIIVGVVFLIAALTGGVAALFDRFR